MLLFGIGSRIVVANKIIVFFVRGAPWGHLFMLCRRGIKLAHSGEMNVFMVPRHSFNKYEPIEEALVYIGQGRCVNNLVTPYLPCHSALSRLGL